MRARTFDAWAYEVLLQSRPDVEWGTVAFDERIAAAAQAVEKGALEIGDAVPPATTLLGLTAWAAAWCAVAFAGYGRLRRARS